MVLLLHLSPHLLQLLAAQPTLCNNNCQCSSQVSSSSWQTCHRCRRRADRRFRSKATLPQTPTQPVSSNRRSCRRPPPPAVQLPAVQVVSHKGRRWHTRPTLAYRRRRAEVRCLGSRASPQRHLRSLACQTCSSSSSSSNGSSSNNSSSSKVWSNRAEPGNNTQEDKDCSRRYRCKVRCKVR